jgi:linoleate 8R-lipoxygenase/9,12-octadecadienoate 8-hydroperoxide 8R-isomerase
MSENNNGTANGRENPIEKIEKVVEASLRPLPTETGDGTYIQSKKMTGFAKDLKHIDLNDVKTLAEVAKSAVSGEPLDDRDYVMEGIVQVCFPWTIF